MARRDPLAPLVRVYREAAWRGGGPVSFSCARLLYMLAFSIASFSSKKINMVDLGAGYGVSTLALALGLREAGAAGVVHAVERDPGRLKALEAFARELGVEDYVDVICGDAAEAVRGFSGLDLAFVDLGSPVEAGVLMPLAEAVADDGLLVFHDVIIHVFRMPTLHVELMHLGFVAARLPIDTGLLLAARARLDSERERMIAKLYMDAVTAGAHPVSLNTGILLRVLARAVAGRAAGSAMLDIGTGLGVSAVNLAVGAKYAGRVVYGLEPSGEKLRRAREAASLLGVDDVLILREIPAEEALDSLDRDVSLAFIDAEKRSYARYLRLLEPWLRPGALVIAHNTVSHAHLMADYLEAAHLSGDYVSVTTLPDPAGLTISVKRRA